MVMEQHRWSHLDYYQGLIKGVTIPRDILKFRILEKYILKDRKSNNPKDYSYEDYKVSFAKPFDWIQDYIRDHFNVAHKKILIPIDWWGNLYRPFERSHTRHTVKSQELDNSGDYTWVYCVDVQPNSCELVVEYDNNRIKDNTWHFPLENNKYILFPATQRYFISQNKSMENNVFFTTVCQSMERP